jgi:predicted ATPase/DNA-binding XRE family transcriptional regulator
MNEEESVEFTPPFGRWLKERRQALDLTQDELARQLGYASDTLRKLETGARRPSRQAAELLAEHLRISPGDCEAFIAFARGTEYRRWHLAPPISSLVGRDQEVHLIQEMLGREDVRLLSLVGPPGVGKTRLAQEAAHLASDAFADGACFVGVASTSDPSLVGSVIAETLGLRHVHDRSVKEGLVSFLSDKQLLLLLDNFEHLTLTAPLLTELLSHAAGLKIMVTSRTLLHLTGEYVFEVAPLATPTPESHLPVQALLHYPAIELFVGRARQAKPSFALTESNARAVTEVCYSLDGLPLAIELAAARVHAFSPQTILLRLDHHAGAKLHFLNVGARNLSPRQQALRTAIDWSYDLLNPDEQAVFRQMGIFIGGCTLEAAESVCDSVVALSRPPETAQRQKPDFAQLLESLVGKSLVQEGEDAAGQSRYTMLETIREYALERLEVCGEAEATRRRHGRYYAHKCELDVNSPDWPVACTSLLKEFTRERNNLYAALSWSKSCADEPLLHMLISTTIGWLVYVGGWYYGTRGDIGIIKSELVWSLERNPDCSPIWHAISLQTLGVLWEGLDNFDQAACALDESLALSLSAEAMGIAASALHLRAYCAYRAGDLALAEHFFERQLELGEQLDVPGWVLNGLSMLGHLALERGDLSRAEEYLERTLALARSMKIKTDILGGQAIVLQDMGLAAYEQGDYTRAYSLGCQALSFFDEEGEMQRRYTQHLYLGRVSLALKHTRIAEQHLMECLRITQEYGLRSGYALAQLAEAATQWGDMPRYARLMGAASKWVPDKQPWGGISKHEHFRCLSAVAEAQAHLCDPAFAAAWAEGQAMTLDQVLDDALQE